MARPDVQHDLGEQPLAPVHFAIHPCGKPGEQERLLGQRQARQRFDRMGRYILATMLLPKLDPNLERRTTSPDELSGPHQPRRGK